MPLASFFSRVEVFMHKNHKTGFTLVELMVVIVIMGILAGVAIPKLTNSVTKAKASEVAPAANTYIKLQNAYVMEKKRIGSWRKIGYTKPKSDVFTYDKADIKVATNVSNLGESGLVGWKATNKAPLGGCTIDNEWTVTILNKGADSDGNIQLEYKSDVTSSECAAISGDWGVVGGNTQVAASSSDKKYTSLSTSLYQKNGYDENGVYTLAKAILSGRDTKEMSGVYQTTPEKAQSFSEIYHIDGFVENQAIGENDYLKGNSNQKDENKGKSLLSMVNDDLKTNMSSGSMKILTNFQGNETIEIGKTYKATQTIYYNRFSTNNTALLNVYATREVMVKVGENNTYTYYDESGNLLDNVDGWTKNDIVVNDPRKDEQWYSDSPIKSESNSSFASVAYDIMASNAGSSTKGFIDKHSEVVGFINTQQPDGSSLATALTDKEKTFEKIKIVTEYHVTDKTLKQGNLYAVSVSLLYGSNNDAHVYNTREIYAVVDNASNGIPIFFEDPECSQIVYPRKNISFWDTENKY